MSASSHHPAIPRDDLAWQLLQEMSEAVFLVDPESLTILEANPSSERLTGQSRDEIVGRHLAQIVSSPADSELAELIQRSQGETAFAADQSCSLTESDGRVRNVDLSIRSLNSEGQRLAVITARPGLTDLAERRRSAQLNVDADDSDQVVEDVFQTFEGFAWAFDLKANVFTYVSSRAEDILGYPIAEWINDPEFFPRVLHPEDRDETIAYCAQKTKGGFDHAMTYRMIAADGTIHWIRDIVYLNSDQDGHHGEVTQLRGLMVDITDTRRLQDELRQTEEQFRRLFDESPIALLELDWSGVRDQFELIQNSGVTDPAAWLEENPEETMRLSQLTRITAVNRGALEMFEASSIDEFKGNVGSLFREDSLTQFREHLLFRLNGGRKFEADNVAYTLSGRRIHVHISATSAADSEQSLDRVYASISDITQRTHAQLLRHGQSHVLETLASTIAVNSVMRTLTAELEKQSPYLRAAVFRTTSSGSALQALSGAGTPQELVTLIDSIQIADLFGNSGQYADLQLAPIQSDHSRDEPECTPPAVVELISRAIGLCGYRHGVLKPTIGRDGRLLGILAVFRRESPSLTPHEADAISTFSDLTALVLEHDRHRRALIVRTDELQSVFETYPDALLRIASDGTILERYSGNRLTEILRLAEVPSEQILWHLLPRGAFTQVRAAIEKVKAGSRQETVNFSIAHDQDSREFEARFLPLPSSNEQIVVLRDVTLLKRTELALEYASERFRYLFDNSPDAIFVESPEGFVLDANQAACKLHRVQHEQLVGQNVVDLIPEDDREAAVSRSNALVSGEISEFESRSLRSDGQIIPVDVRISTITYDGDLAVLLHVRDITQQKQEEDRKREHERQLAHVSRLTMIGQLVAGIAHEIRQPLWSISTFADVCVETLGRLDVEERLPQIRDVAGKLVVEARRANAITTRMFAFARKGKPERTACDLLEIVGDAIELTAGRARSSRIRTTLTIGHDPPLILCDRVLIEQTLVNLLNNAYAALAEHPANPRTVAVEVTRDTEDLEYVNVCVRDNGPGLPNDVIPEQLFEGFFTTGQTGLGIGLALSRSFVEDHGGAIRAEQLPDGGMEFVFTLRIDGGNHADAE
jgi:PAS domain S-box-containing protein